MSKFKSPKCQVCGYIQRASSLLQWKNGNYACRCNSVDYSKATKYRRDNPVLIEDCKELTDDEELKFTVIGPPAIKKNSQRIVMKGIRPSILYEVWASKAIKQLQEQWKDMNRLSVSGKIWIESHYYRNTSRKCDLSNLHEGIQDCLTTVGVWVDDSQIESHDKSRKHQDNNPRIEITLRRYTE